MLAARTFIALWRLVCIGPQRGRACAIAGPATMAFLAAFLLATDSARAQAPEIGWDAGVTAPSDPQQVPASPNAQPSGAQNLTVVPRTGGDPSGDAGTAVPVRLEAHLTADGQQIEQGLVWRIYQEGAGADGKSKLVSTHRDGAVIAQLKPGDYAVNAAYGKAHLTRRIKVTPGAGDSPAVERFVLNAGGLRVQVKTSGADLPASLASYSIYSDRDQSDSRATVLAGAKPGLIIRLNAGIYHIVSTYGDTNAVVHSDVTVEAGKLTEVTVAHAAAKASFKLVQRAGGEALPDTQWVIQTPQGRSIKESVGALPSHILAPGTYTVVAKSQGKLFQRDFSLENGETTQVEVIMK